MSFAAGFLLLLIITFWLIFWLSPNKEEAESLIKFFEGSSPKTFLFAAGFLGTAGLIFCFLELFEIPKKEDSWQIIDFFIFSAFIVGSISGIILNFHALVNLNFEIWLIWVMIFAFSIVKVIFDGKYFLKYEALKRLNRQKKKKKGEKKKEKKKKEEKKN